MSLLNHTHGNDTAKNNSPLHSHFFQPKLSINSPGDMYEQQADAMADRVTQMSLPNKKDTFFKPAISSIQRKCAACEEEEKYLHRKEISTSILNDTNDLDSYVSSLSSSGSPLPENSRNFFEPRFGHDFSNVRIHTDSAAAQSAQSVNALAYTTGNNIVFNQGQYSPNSESGQRLMAHELTHVVQQGEGKAGKKIQKQQSPFTGFSQGNIDDCGAASVISAIQINDRQSANAAHPNQGFIAACNIVLTYYSMHQSEITTRFIQNNHKTPDEANNLYWQLRHELLRIRNEVNGQGTTPGRDPTEGDFQLLSASFYALGMQTGAGLSQSAIEAIMDSLGLHPTAQASGIESFDAMMANTVLSGLTPGQTAQISWYVRTGTSGGHSSYGMHAFLIGRLNDGTWFLNDQGTNPAEHLTATSLPGLKTAILVAASHGYWIFTGSIHDFSTLILGAWTGITVLGNASGLQAASTNLLTGGTKVAAVDAGIFTFSSDITIDSFQNEFYDITQATTAAAGISSKGGAIIEMPQGRFLVYSTNMVSNANKNETSIDSGGGGDFSHHRFFHAWLQLRAPSGTGSFFSVY